MRNLAICLLGLSAIGATPSFDSFPPPDFVKQGQTVRIDRTTFPAGGGTAKVHAGTNTSVIVNGGTNYISADVSHAEVTAAKIFIKAGTNFVIVTNGNLFTLSATGTGSGGTNTFIAVGTGLSASTNSSNLTTVSAPTLATTNYVNSATGALYSVFDAAGAALNATQGLAAIYGTAAKMKTNDFVASLNGLGTNTILRSVNTDVKFQTADGVTYLDLHTSGFLEIPQGFTGPVDGSQLTAGTVANAALVNSSISINGSAISLGGSITGLATSNAIANYVLTNRTISTTSPLTGGGALNANLTLAINNAAADGSTKGAATFTAADFDASSGLISIDYVNGQASSASANGFLTSADWSTFNSKQGTLTWNYPLSISGSTVSDAALTNNEARVTDLKNDLHIDASHALYLSNVTVLLPAAFDARGRITNFNVGSGLGWTGFSLYVDDLSLTYERHVATLTNAIGTTGSGVFGGLVSSPTLLVSNNNTTITPGNTNYAAFKGTNSSATADDLGIGTNHNVYIGTGLFVRGTATATTFSGSGASLTGIPVTGISTPSDILTNGYTLPITFKGPVSLSNVTASSLVSVDAQGRATNAVIGSGLSFSANSLSASGGTQVYSNQLITLTGTANRVTVTPATMDLTTNTTVTFTGPQDIATNSSPQFATPIAFTGLQVGTNIALRSTNEFEVWGTNTVNPAFEVRNTNGAQRVVIGGAANGIEYFNGATSEFSVNKAGAVTSAGSGSFAGASVTGGNTLSFSGGAGYMSFFGGSSFREYDNNGKGHTSLAGAGGNGYLVFGFRGLTKITNYVFINSESGSVANNLAASGPVTNTLPAAIATTQSSTGYIEYQYGADVLTAQPLCLATLGTTNVIYFGGWSGTNLFSSTINSSVHLHSVSNSAWMVDQLSGVWQGLTNSAGVGMAASLPAPTAGAALTSTVPQTNTFGVPIQVCIDNGAGVTATLVKKNGGTIFSTMAAAVTLNLQPGEYFSETFSLGTPTWTWNPLQ